MEKPTVAGWPGDMTELLAGIAIKNLTRLLPIDVSAFSSAQPTSQQFAQLAERGVATVINLRPQSEMVDLDEAALVGELGMGYVQIPIANENDLTIVNARSFALVLENNPVPFLIHCAGGNRVGALFALKAFMLDGYTAEQALELGLQAGLTGLHDAVAAVMK